MLRDRAGEGADAPSYARPGPEFQSTRGRVTGACDRSLRAGRGTRACAGGPRRRAGLPARASGGSPDGGGFSGPTDQALEAHGLARRVVLTVPHFLALLAILARTDLVAMVPSRPVRGACALRVVEPPVEVTGFGMSMLWHERAYRETAHRWLREYIADLG
ncbi:LysR substrate-binding domain-containing protein [Luteimonas sp. RD2P54]|uniref:LysR substrate-binding domain-containing protein n=1 Tax=Luteimonas endophytica TaxID=3042023 RepID=A0ABT6JDX6_9GAMM|nr:LysR substrate-binding domain-containing protein [Luteimonas endophytica]MDH5825029.1 LysR substrate-binding domain-containing protein [Luteimonas endophytica]